MFGDSISVNSWSDDKFINFKTTKNKTVNQYLSGVCHYTFYMLTLTVGSLVARHALTAVAVHVIVTRRAVDARTGQALVDLFC